MSDDQLDRLIDALTAQTAAMHALAESNRAVVDLVIAQHADEDDEPQGSSTYLDGTPIEG